MIACYFPWNPLHSWVACTHWHALHQFHKAADPNLDVAISDFSKQGKGAWTRHCPCCVNVFVPSGHWLWSCSRDYCERGSIVCNESGLLQVTFSVLSFNESYGVWCVCVLTSVMCVAWMLVAVGLCCCINHCCSSHLCVRLFMWACPVFSKISYIVYTYTSLLQVCGYIT